MTARVLLGDSLVGHLRPIGDRVALSFDPSYCARPDRLVLSRAFEERRLDPHIDILGGSAKEPLPCFFRNALPEGALRSILEARFRHSTMPEYEMLLRLGGDLPGNVRVESDELLSFDDSDEASVSAAASSGPDPLRFSLAGIQLKASVLVKADKITLPLVGAGGDWIAKFPSSVFRELPENEHAILRWARAAGLNVPEHRLVPVAGVENLPSDFPNTGQALLIKRFDRIEDGKRLHQEDFAQIFGVQPEDRYLGDVPDYAHYAGIGAIIRALCGPDDFVEYARRVAFMILSGNGDAHVKNWALVYPDGIRARLSPLYDFLATVAYPRLGASLALGFVEPEDPWHVPGIAMSTIDYAAFREMAQRAGEDPDVCEADVRRFMQQARDLWPSMRDEFPEFARPELERHMAAIALT